MIVKMSKYAFMVYHKEYEDFLLKLRDWRVVHVKGNNTMQDNDDVQEILHRRKQIDTALRQLKEVNSETKDILLAEDRHISKEEGFRLLSLIDELNLKRNKLSHAIEVADKEISYWDSTWGSFSYEMLKKVQESGYTIRFFSCPTSEYKDEWETEHNAITVLTAQTLCYFVTITPKEQPVKIHAERVTLPAHDRETLLKQVEELTAELGRTEEEIKRIAAEEYNSLNGVDRQLWDEYNFAHVLTQTIPEVDNKLMLLEGWVPRENAAELEKNLDEGGYFYRQLEIEETDQVPIKLKNNSFVKLYEPISRMFSLPNYREFDPTPFFAPFFMLFFGMCFADGGYGLLMFTVCTVIKKKLSPDYRPFATLFQYLGAAAFFVGSVSGSFFGVELVKLSVFAAVKDYFLTTDNLMTISLVLGIIHIIFGKGVAAMKKISQKGVKYGIAPFAWVFVITSMVLAFGLPEIDIKISKGMTDVLFGIAGVSLIIALLYNSPGKNIFLNLGSGIWNLYNMASGLLGDTLSYIRLFAIGLTGAILGGVFNSLALTMTDGMSIIPKILLMTIILLFGHTLNFGLCTISSLVHPLRLVFVEYYKNAEFEGGGKEYEPFRKA